MTQLLYGLILFLAGAATASLIILFIQFRQNKDFSWPSETMKREPDSIYD